MTGILPDVQTIVAHSGQDSGHSGISDTLSHLCQVFGMFAKAAYMFCRHASGRAGWSSWQRAHESRGDGRCGRECGRGRGGCCAAARRGAGLSGDHGTGALPGTEHGSPIHTLGSYVACSVLLLASEHIDPICTPELLFWEPGGIMR